MSRAVRAAAPRLVLQKRYDVVVVVNVIFVVLRRVRRLILVIGMDSRLGSCSASVVVIILVFNITAIGGPAWTFSIDEIPDRDGADHRHCEQEPPRSGDKITADAPGKGGAGKRGASRSTDSAESGGEAVEGTQDAEGGAGVGQENSHAGEADDDSESLQAHDDEKSGVAKLEVFDENREWREDVNQREEETWGVC